MSKPSPLATRPGLSLAPMLASADDTEPSRPVSPRPTRFQRSWSQPRSQGPVVRGVFEPSDFCFRFLGREHAVAARSRQIRHQQFAGRGPPRRCCCPRGRRVGLRDVAMPPVRRPGPRARACMPRRWRWSLSCGSTILRDLVNDQAELFGQAAVRGVVVAALPAGVLDARAASPRGLVQLGCQHLAGAAARPSSAMNRADLGS